MQFIRQGDVLLAPVDAIPETATQPVARDKGDLILAYGEVTGHSHKITSPHAVMFSDPELNRKFMRVTEPVSLVHDEHYAHEIPVGLYQVIIQREYSDTPVKDFKGDLIQSRLVAD